MPRPLGVPNAKSIRIRDAIQKVFEELGGAEGMKTWVKANDANKRIFYGQILPKMMPLQVGNDGGEPLRISITQDEKNAL